MSTRQSPRQLIDEAAGMSFGRPRRSVLRAAIGLLEAEEQTAAVAEAHAVALAMLAQQDEACLTGAERALNRAENLGAPVDWIRMHLAEAYSATGDPAAALRHASAVDRRFFDERDLHWRSVRMDEIRTVSMLLLGQLDQGVESAVRIASELALRGDLDDLAPPVELTRTALSLIRSEEPARHRAGCAVLSAISVSIDLAQWFESSYAAELTHALEAC